MIDTEALMHVLREPGSWVCFAVILAWASGVIWVANQ